MKDPLEWQTRLLTHVEPGCIRLRYTSLHWGKYYSIYTEIIKPTASCSLSWFYIIITTEQVQNYMRETFLPGALWIRSSVMVVILYGSHKVSSHEYCHSLKKCEKILKFLKNIWFHMCIYDTLRILIMMHSIIGSTTVWSKVA